MKKIIIHKTVIFLLIFAGIFCCLNSCKKTTELVGIEINDTRLHIVWSKSFYTDSIAAMILTPIVANGYVAFVGYPYASHVDNRMVIFNKTNGEYHPALKGGTKIDDYPYPPEDFLIGGNNKDVIFYSTRESLNAFNIISGQYLWKYTYEEPYFSDVSGRPSILGADIIIPYLGLNTTSIYNVNRYNSATGQKTNLFSFDNMIYTVECIENEYHDTLLFFSDGWKNSYCYNLTKDSVIWKHTIASDELNLTNSFYPIVVENKYVLFQYRYEVYCMDFFTGKQIWNNYVGTIDYSPILYHDGKVIVRPNEGNVSCFDVRNGDLLWKNTDVNTFLDNSRKYGKMDVYKGNLYLTTSNGIHNHIYSDSYKSSLCCLSLTTGLLNWTEKNITGGVAIDQQTGYLYCQNGISVICVDLNKTPIK